MLHIAEQYAGLLPDDAKAKSRAISWIFAALNTIEPPILDLSIAKVGENDKAWSEQRLPLVKDRIRNKLKQLSAYLGEKSWLEDEFSVGDLMMISVLLRLRASGILLEFPNLDDYVTRGESRPAYQRAFAAQLAINAP
ncbi:MAG TPA: glutathione S-transferase C-terminal domain-containing protein [Acinetobacter sp.]|nr:glutathione S-transferase C-terminal domain-containing protein [Acinetobacter sp.]